MKLYDLYSVISNKTVRKHENFYKKFKKTNKECPGILIKTNRGYFIDGHNVDYKSAAMWFIANGYKDKASELLVPEKPKTETAE